MSHSIFSRLREYVGDRRRSPRRGARFAARVPAVVVSLDPTAAGPEHAGGPSIAAETRDLGPSGLTLFVGKIRVGGQYLTDAERHLGVRLELPSGETHLLARAVRFEQAEGGGAEAGFLLGLRLIRAREPDRTRYLDFLKSLAPSDRRRRERAGAQVELSGLLTSGGGMTTAADTFTPAEISAAFDRFVGGKQSRAG